MVHIISRKGHTGHSTVHNEQSKESFFSQWSASLKPLRTAVVHQSVQDTRTTTAVVPLSMSGNIAAYVCCLVLVVVFTFEWLYCNSVHLREDLVVSVQLYYQTDCMSL